MNEIDTFNRRELALVAHELRNPLSTLQSGLHILEISPSSPQALRSIELMKRQLQHALHIVNDLLDFSRINNRRLAISSSRHLIGEVITLALEITASAIKKSQHVITVILPEEPISFNGDLHRLTQVVVNLIDNAAKYTPARGRITVSVERLAPCIAVTVADNGIGLAAGVLKTLWSPFNRAEKPIGSGGLGLGLFLVKKIVEAHGGQVEAHSAGVGQGAAFTVKIPESVEPW